MTNANLLQRIIKFASKIEEHESRAVFLSFSFVFLLMAGYYILRPVRDAMASDWTDTELSILWNLNFFVSIVVVALYGFAVARVRFSVLVPGVYAVFAAVLTVPRQIRLHFSVPFGEDMCVEDRGQRK